MNKKIIAIAIASAMAAPAVMADVTVSGRMGGHLTSSSKEAAAGTDTTASSREFKDNGASRLQFDAKTGKAFARIAASAAGLLGGGGFTGRDAYLGYKIGGGAISFGRMAGAAKNLEKDPYITTFLEMRTSIAQAVSATKYGSSGFINSIVQYDTKVGGMKLIVQFDPTDNTGQSDNEGHLGASLAGKAGGVNWWAAYNNGSADGTGVSSNQTNAKVGASMKFGKTKLTVNVTDTKLTNENKITATSVDANFGLSGGLSANVGYASNSDNGTWVRAAVMKNLAKGADVYAGITTVTPVTGTGATVIGAGAVVKF